MADDRVIVFPTDFSELSASAVDWAMKMAASQDAELHCVHVVEEPHVYGMLDLGPVELPSASELTGWATERLEQYAARYFAGLARPAVAKVLVGRPSEEIVNYASDHGAAMIVMTTHGRSGVRHLLLGSTTQAVLRQAPCPVLSIRIA